MATTSTKCKLDWTKCIFCQKDLQKVKTICPANSKKADAGSGYKTLADLVESFRELGGLPEGLKVDLWDEGDGIADTLSQHKAVFHHHCRSLLHPTTLERLRKRCADDNESHDEESSGAKTQRLTRAVSGSKSTDFTSLCFFCEMQGSEKLRQALTDKLHNRVLKCAELLNDTMILAKLAAGHMSAREHKYHPTCLLAFYRKADRVATPVPNDDNDNCQMSIDSDSIALAEVVAYMEEVRSAKGDTTPCVFTLHKLSDFYSEQIKRHHGLSTQVNTTRLKERLTEIFPDLITVTQGRDVLLTFDDDVANTLKQATASHDANAIHLMHTAKLVRTEMFSCATEFDGSFHGLAQNNSVPPTLLTLVNMLLEGPGNFNSTNNQAALSIAQLIVFNAVKRARRTTNADAHIRSPIIRHPHSQETPLPIYVGMMLHSATRKAKLVDKCYKLGISVSYQRVMQLSNKMTNTVCASYRSQDLVCPPALRGGLFSVAAVDNIDHNVSSNTAVSSFHGTAMSIMQFPTVDNAGVDRSLHHSLSAASDNISSIVLPLSYSDVSPCVLPSTDPILPHVDRVMTCSSNIVARDVDWLNHIMDSVENQTAEPVNITWAGYHSELCEHEIRPRPIISMLPMFRHSAHTAAMIRHSLIVIERAIRVVNPGQIPVVTYDQPLFALAKQIQWHWPHDFGEDKFVVMMGGLHIEMAALRMLGHWLESSGWVHCLVQADVSTPGVAESFIHASHVKRTRYAHTVTAASLFVCQQRSFAQFCDGLSESDHVSFEDWRCSRLQASTQFKYWDTVLQMELTLLSFVRSVRERNFSLYTETLESLLPWFFALDQTHYARWLSVHLRDMLNLKHCHPDIEQQFQAGNFTVDVSNKRFSAMPIDQAHEQMNALIKGDGGAIGITENEAALTRWIIASPEILRILSEFEGHVESVCDEHHEQKPGYQKRFQQHVLSLMQAFDDVGNPFCDMSDELIALDTNNVAPSNVCESVVTAYDVGLEQFSTFWNDRVHGSVSVLSTIPRNKLCLFNSKSAPGKKGSKSVKLSEMKSDCELFSRLYIVCQSRDGNLDEFFTHENQPYPPSLSQNGDLRFGTKSDLLSCILDKDQNSSADISKLCVDCYILDGAVITQMIRPGCSRNFEEYGKQMILPYITSMATKVLRLDIVFDTYVADSLKSSSRSKRGIGTRTRVTASTKIPKNWQSFLRLDSNKTELFHYLATLLITEGVGETKQLCVTYDQDVKCNGDVDIGSIAPCSHEEADTRMILHCLHASNNGCKKVAIRTVDTDVVVLAIAFFDRVHLDELWIHFGTGKNVRFIAVHEIAKELGLEKCRALPVFHAITGCDTTSAFSHKGKKSAWEAWTVYPVVTQAFLNLYDVEADVDQATTAVLQRFVIVMYDRTSDCVDLNSCRRQLFTKRNCSLELLPPTSNSFDQHVRRTVYQAGFVWNKSLDKHPQVRDPCSWGWRKDGSKLVPVWMTIPEVIYALSELIHCGCKKGCTARCKCVKANLSCTPLCSCDGECDR